MTGKGLPEGEADTQDTRPTEPLNAATPTSRSFQLWNYKNNLSFLFFFSLLKPDLVGIHDTFNRKSPDGYPNYIKRLKAAL